MAKKEIGRPQTAHIAPFGLRLQPELKDRIEQASKASGRSMNAEISARLEASFAQPAIDFTREVDLQIESVRSQLTMQDLRLDLLKSRIEGLLDRSRLIEIDSERLTRNAKTDEDFARADEAIAQLRGVEAEVFDVGTQVDAVAAERKETLERLQRLQAIFTAARGQLEKRIQDGRSASLSPDPTTKAP